MSTPYSPDANNPYAKGPDTPSWGSNPPQYPSGGSGGGNGGFGGGSNPGGAKPDNYLVWAILATLLCCIPLGIPAIIYATGVDSAWFRGDANAARVASENAKKWSIIAAVAGLVGTVLYVIMIVGFGLTAPGMS